MQGDPHRLPTALKLKAVVVLASQDSSLTSPSFLIETLVQPDMNPLNSLKVTDQLLSVSKHFVCYLSNIVAANYCDW